MMATLLSMLLSIFGQYQEADEGMVYVQSYQMIRNDKVEETIVACKKGKKKFTFHLLIVNNEHLIVDVHN
jgi:hypothetical protein